MKRIMMNFKAIPLTFLFTFSVVTGLLAQDKSEYRQAMGDALSEMNAITDHATYLDLANKFQRIAENETTEWLPAYYAALCTTLYSFGEKDALKIDPLLDQAQIMIDKIIKLNEKESEIWVLQGLLYQARIMVDPMTRGQNLVMKANEAFNKAESLNPENPRVYYLKGQNLLNTPEMFGGGKQVAKPLFQKASEKFLSFKPADSLSPNWGKAHNEQLLMSCE
ncbi:MAG: hypothetical protein Q8908_11890 [Bacteroidota bacterium]|nr:hypothetical protein [Bacteroidota bacterium]